MQIRSIEKASSALAQSVRIKTSSRESSKIIGELADQISGKFMRNNTIIIENIGKLSQVMKEMERFQKDFLPFFQRFGVFAQEFNTLVEISAVLNEISRKQEGIANDIKRLNGIALALRKFADMQDRYNKDMASLLRMMVSEYARDERIGGVGWLK